MSLKLVSFKLCPFVQRVAIVLLWKQIEFEIEYIELSNPPAWFRELSPFNKVPLLVAGEDVIFESTAINEYLDETRGEPLHPTDPVARAINRSWIEFSDGPMWGAFQLSVDETEQAFNRTRDGLLEKLDQMEEAVSQPFFNGSNFSLVDASYAPLMQRLSYINALRPGVVDPQRHPRLTRWTDNLLSFDAVRQSTVSDIRDLYLHQLAKRKGYISRYLPEHITVHDGERQIY